MVEILFKLHKSREGNKMASYDNWAQKSQVYRNKSINVVDLINRAKFQEKKEKRSNVFFAISAAFILAISGFIISL